MAAPEVTVNPPADPPEPPKENATIVQMRSALDAANAAKKEAADKAAQLESQLQAIEREKMTELEKLKAEKADAEKRAGDLETIRDEHGKFSSRFEELYNKALEAVPEDKRANVERLSNQGSWADRFDAIQGAIELLGPVVVPPVVVPRVQPHGAPPPNNPPVTPQPKTNAEIAKSGGLMGMGLQELEAVDYRKDMKKQPTQAGQ